MLDCFLITGDNASGTLALFELTVPAAQRLAAPAHSHNHYGSKEERAALADRFDMIPVPAGSEAGGSRLNPE